MKTLFAKYKWMQLIYGLLLLVAGVLIIVAAIKDKTQVSEWLSVIVAVGLFIYSAALLFTGVFSLKKKYFDITFIYAVLFVSVGVCLLCNRDLIDSFITIFVATLITAMGVVEIGEATSMIFFKRPVFFVVLFYILGAALITLGVLAFCFKDNVSQIIYVGVGVIMCLTALLQIGLGIHGLFIARKLSKLEKENVVDAEVTEVPSDNKEETKEETKQIEEKKDDEPVDVIDLDHDDHHSNSNPDA